MIVRHAPAKVNLGLAVHGRRADGYHDISTIFLKVSLSDELVFEETSRDIVVQCDHPAVPRDARNLVYRAAAALKPLAPKRGVRVRLQKTIPVAAGLGGGSSDAAATLAGLNTLWELGLSQTELIRYGTSLGADVPFFLLPAIAAFGQGRGDELESLTCPWNFYLVVVNPRLTLSTAWVYSQYKFELTARMNDTTILRQCLESGDIAGLATALFNDLEAVVLPQFPGVQEVKRVLTRPEVSGVCMSGSGPTVYALCTSQTAAYNVAAALQHCAWDVWVCQPWRDGVPETP
jgi:4-diphosphocytidyl-2-C-methyl-D-erythritol kinase